MPKALERSLKVTARKRGYSKERTNAYVYGTLRKTGWTPSTQKKHRVLKKIIHMDAKKKGCGK
jgi:hypothetical protein